MTTELPTPPAPHHVDKHSPSLISLPPEVTTKIYEYSASFSDVFALAATGRRLNHVWRTSVNHIYHSVAARSISCARDARRFLVEQRQYGSKPEESHPMDVGSVHQMVRNANIVEKAVLQFELEIVCRVRSKLHFTSQSEVRNQSSRRGGPNVQVSEQQEMEYRLKNSTVQEHSSTLPP